MIVRSLLVGALVLVPAALARADGCPRNPGNPPAPAPAPQAAPMGAPQGAPTSALPAGSHGGSIVVLGADRSQFEVLRDASTGKVTVWSISSPSSSSFAVAQAPVVKLDDGREITLVALPGETNAWAVTDDSFRNASFTGRLMVRSNDRWESAALTPAPSPAPKTGEAGPSPAVPTAWSEPTAAHGGRILAACGGSFEFVRDAATGKATLYLLPQGNAKLSLDNDPVLSVKSAAGDTRSLPMTAVAGSSNTWEVTVDVFKGDAAPEGTVKVSVDGRPCELNLSALPAANLPANPPAAPANLPEGDKPAPAPRANEPAPTPVTKPGEQPAPPDAPGVKNPGGDRGDLAVPGTTALVFGGGIAKFDLRHDTALGRLTLTTPSDVHAARLDGAPVLVLETPSGKKELTFEKGAADGTWTLTSDELKSTSPMKGIVRITIEGKQLEADAAPQLADSKPAPSEMR